LLAGFDVPIDTYKPANKKHQEIAVIQLQDVPTELAEIVAVC